MAVKIGSPPLYRLVRGAFGIMFRLRGGFRVLGAERVPSHGGLIVASVHMSHLDPPALACAMPRRRLLAMAKEELFNHRAFGWLIAKIGAFPVKRGEADTESVRLAVSYLADGQSMIVFPEGTRNDGIRMLPIERGVGMLARKTGCQVLPVGIHGTQRLMPLGGGGVRSHRVTVAIGQPFTYQETAQGRNERENRELFAGELERRILEQCRIAGLDLQPPVTSGSESAGELDASQDVSVPVDHS